MIPVGAGVFIEAAGSRGRKVRPVDTGRSNELSPVS
jgi:hypothetical protein